MNRDLALDSLRGFMVLYMFSQHLLMGPMSASNWIERYTIYPLGWSPAAAGFILISGIVIGMGYSRLYEKKGYQALAKASQQQAWKIYLTHMATFAIVLVGAQFRPEMLLGDSRVAMMGETPIRQFLLGAMLLYQPTFYDILPMYCLYLLITPWVIRSLHAHGPGRALAVSAGLWLAMQLGGAVVFSLFIDKIRGAQLGLFNPFAWQLVYVAGLYFGFQRTRPGGVFDNLSGNTLRWLLAAAVLINLGGLVTRWSTDASVLPWLQTQLRWKTVFPPLFLVNFTAFSFIIGFLARRYPNAFHWKATCFVGKHPLICFAFHLVIVMYLQGAHEWIGSLADPVRILLLCAVLTTIALPAWLEDLWQQKKARERALARAAVTEPAA